MPEACCAKAKSAVRSAEIAIVINTTAIFCGIPDVFSIEAGVEAGVEAEKEVEIEVEVPVNVPDWC
jgi:hypothetical protein